MKYGIILIFLMITSSTVIYAQDQAASTPEEQAKVFLSKGDYTNAIMLLNRAAQGDPNSIEIQKDLAYAYLLKRDFVKGLEVAEPIVKRKDADVRSFQILGLIYKGIEQKKDAEKMYREGLKRFPSSGALHNEYGEVLWAKQQFADASKSWEKGILAEPTYPGNYYNAAKYYYLSADKVWGLLYGEIFINLESYSQRTLEIQQQLQDGYKKLFTDADIMKNQKNRSEFATAVLEVMNKNRALVDGGVSPESLNKLRRKFIADWYEQFPKRFPFRLFEYQKQLINANMFDAYNQWAVAGGDEANYKKWVSEHEEEAQTFANFQRNRVFKLPKGQYYQVIQK
ncbi:MAG: hypothetical protein EOO02_07905 [Chitinophagaceae bacterium]|nr:MAG: hypothetical protein EOO02_07905 [Chitinophagaceae bacterium]